LGALPDLSAGSRVACLRVPSRRAGTATAGRSLASGLGFQYRPARVSSPSFGNMPRRCMTLGTASPMPPGSLCISCARARAIAPGAGSRRGCALFSLRKGSFQRGSTQDGGMGGRTWSSPAGHPGVDPAASSFGFAPAKRRFAGLVGPHPSRTSSAAMWAAGWGSLCTIFRTRGSTAVDPSAEFTGSTMAVNRTLTWAS
jgi:hypothetical protein